MDSVSVAFELMRLELAAEVENLNADGAKHFLDGRYSEAQAIAEKGRSMHAFLQKVLRLEEEWKKSFSNALSAKDDQRKVIAASRKILSATKSSRTGLVVRFPDGHAISEKKAADTLVKTIERIGFERVEPLGILVNGEDLVSNKPSVKEYNETKIGTYYIKTHSNTEKKRRDIEQISRLLNLHLEVIIVA